MDAKALIESGKTALGIELGSTRIKGVLIDLKGRVLAVGIHDWENSFVDNIWTYSLRISMQESVTVTLPFEKKWKKHMV